jgi:hypothetical protein
LPPRLWKRGFFGLRALVVGSAPTSTPDDFSLGKRPWQWVAAMRTPGAGVFLGE